ncbi:molybdopterin-dependent oxidoreductase [Pseudonocardia sp. TRM90224]|uniref:molybdopterin-dependent oxidoreductase n=1 Tax=Pseudonocardia sp. TRM90224 TaxID=2812678 RepID=UPI001E5C4EB0|nr:molybdopterin-dependent oxidoreductase [Pseudonocardia sp. TRM90224]
MTTIVQPDTRSGIPGGVAAGIGLLAVAAAVGVGHLLGAVIAPTSSPFVAVADTVIRLSPSWLTEFGKSFGPEVDKAVLQVGVAVVLAVAAAIGGFASRQERRPGVTTIAVLGGLGIAAVMFGPVFSPLDLVAPAAALVVGVVTFRALHERALRYAEVAPDDDAERVSRRTVLIGGSAAAGLVALGTGAGGQLLGGSGAPDVRQLVTDQLAKATRTVSAPPIPPGAAYPELGATSFITPNDTFYRIDTALRIPRIDPATWSLRVHGMVDRELTLRFADLLARPLVERTVTLTCVSNEVGGDLISTATFVGVDLRDILAEAGVRAGADQVFTTSSDGWYTGTPTDVVMEAGRGAMLAIGMNGEALPYEHGFPVRMVVPGLYGYVSATKWIVDMELTTFKSKAAYWLERGWAERGPIKTQSRIDVPGPQERVPAGAVTVAGVAWAQHVGIDAVEVRVDGGPWSRAQLAPEVSLDTWRMWRTDVQLGPGSHTVQARAVDRTGATQPEAAAPPAPDGATGWPATIFSVG